MVNFIHHIGSFLIFVATILLIVVSVSTPVWHRVNFLDGTFVSRSILMGNWGLCIDDICSKSRLGYNIADLTNILTGDARIGASIVHGLTYALVLNPIAAGFSFIALLLSFSTHFAVGIAASVAAFFAFLITALALIIDLVLFVTARDRLNRIVDTHVTLGNAMWLVTAALALLLISSFLVCCTHHRNRQVRNRSINDPTYNDKTAYVVDPNYANSPTHSTVPLRSSPVMASKNKWYQRGRNNTNNNGLNHNQLENNAFGASGVDASGNTIGHHHNNGLGVTGTGNTMYQREGVV